MMRSMAACVMRTSRWCGVASTDTCTGSVPPTAGEIGQRVARRGSYRGDLVVRQAPAPRQDADGDLHHGTHVRIGRDGQADRV